MDRAGARAIGRRNDGGAALSRRVRARIRGGLRPWSGLADAQRLLESLRPRLQRFRDQHGHELLDLEDAPRPDAETPAPPRFLPEYDNVLLSHRDRSRIIEEDRRVPLPPGSGAAAGTVLIDGFMRATWKIERTGDQARLVVRPYVPLPRRDADAVSVEGTRLLAFLGADAAKVDLAVVPQA